MSSLAWSANGPLVGPGSHSPVSFSAQVGVQNSINWGVNAGRKKPLLITPENQKINRVRGRQFNSFTQITLLYLAGFVDAQR